MREPISDVDRHALGLGGGLLHEAAGMIVFLRCRVPDLSPDERAVVDQLVARLEQEQP